jgi:lipid-A-disaccharide synthase
MFLNVDHISLVNIIAGKEIVPEMLQYKMRPDMIAETVVELCTDGDRRATMIEELGRVRKMLGEPGASRRAAKVVCEALDLGVHRPSAAGAAGKLVNADG